MSSNTKTIHTHPLRIIPIIAVGLLFMNADCPPPEGNTNGNMNQNTNDNINTGVPDDNVLGLSAAIVTAINFPDARLLVFANPGTIDGDAAPAMTIDVEGIMPVGLDINAAGELIYVDQAGIHIFASSDELADAAPGRHVPRHEIPTHFAYDRARDLIYIGAEDAAFNPLIEVYANSSDADFDGDIAPVRIITNPVLSEKKLHSFTVGPDNRLYAFTQTDSPQKLLVFDNADALDGEVPVDRTVDFTGFQNDEADNLGSPVVDANDNLIMIGLRKTPSAIEVGVVTVAGASTLEGEVTGLTFLDVSANGVPFALAVSGGTAFVSQQANITIFDAIVGRDGAPAPDRHIVGDGTDLFAAKPLLVFE